MILLLHYRMSNTGLTNETVIKFERIFFIFILRTWYTWYFISNAWLVFWQYYHLFAFALYLDMNVTDLQTERDRKRRLIISHYTVAAIIACCFKTANSMAQCNPHLDKCTVRCLLPHRDIVPKVSNPCSPQIKMKWNTCSVGWCVALAARWQHVLASHCSPLRRPCQGVNRGVNAMQNCHLSRV